MTVRVGPTETMRFFLETVWRALRVGWEGFIVVIRDARVVLLSWGKAQ
jgi:hypothetical protein